ncbi:MAG: sulfite exporter TauE/SafE family protein [Clostridia bacterium]|nr:sulfite exporter TauE/SafE family protein [Clostridia bacterium]
MKKFIAAVFGILVGVINGTVGAGGGLVAIPLIKKFDTPQKAAHSTAVAVLMPISAVSAISYLRAGHIAFSDAAPFILPSVIGAVLGTYLLKKIPTAWLKKIFSVFMIYAGVRLFLK